MAVIALLLGGRSHMVQAQVTAAGPDATTKGQRTPNQDGLKRQSQSYLKAKEILGDRFRRYDTDRYVILSDADPDWTRQQGRSLERTYHQFHRFVQWLDLQPLPLQHKLVCILFESRDSYQRFAATQDNISAPWIAGYFAPKHDWVVFYHIEASPSLSAARNQLGRMEMELLNLESQARDAVKKGTEDIESLQDRVVLYRDHLQQQQRRVNSFASETSTATTIHEGVHQLMFHTRVQSPLHVYPLWISEGLAMNFETTTPNQAFGPRYESPTRREQFEALMSSQDLIPLSELIELETHPPNDEQKMRLVYSQSYALVGYLVRFHKPELRNYLQWMRTSAPSRLGSGQQRALFVKCFGDPDVLETRWLRYEHARLAASNAHQTDGLNTQ